jgi:hypothetical protein
MALYGQEVQIFALLWPRVADAGRAIEFVAIQK